ncbi:hypothetical protein [Kitasatospora sp. NPDC051164]
MHRPGRRIRGADGLFIVAAQGGGTVEPFDRSSPALSGAAHAYGRPDG